MTEWRPVPGFDGYLVASDGRIRGRKGRELKLQRETHRSRRGYLFLMVDERYRGGRARKLWAHHAVLLAFVGPRPEGMTARHINGISDDNRLGNLAWGTKAEQVADDRRHGVYHATRRSSWCSDEVVRAIRVAPGRQRDIAARFGVHQATVSHIKRGTQYAFVE